MESRDGMGSRVYDVASRLFFRKLKMFTLKDIFGDPKENRDCSLSCFFVSWMCVVSKCTTLAEFKGSSLKWVCCEGQPEDQLRVMVDLPGDVSERALTHHHSYTSSSCFPSCFSMLSLSLEKLVTCRVIRSYVFLCPYPQGLQDLPGLNS